VAKLARLRLNDKEVQRMASELSGILEHVEHINELDLENVEPTSHVVAIENVLRPDEPRPSWSRDEVLERAPDPAGGSFRVPSPQA
jgi:aspartyl-tRNA(Asn)/glutamyl-tRNA(Gln) amidotransferase subunit C